VLEIFLFGMQIMPLVNRGDAKTMKIAVWVIFSIVTLLWTIGTFIAVKLTQWGTGLLANGNIDPLSRGVADWPLPEGMPEWVDPSMIQTLQQFALLSLDGLRDALPYMSMLMGWLVPMIWAVWGFGLVCLVGLAVAAHWLTARHTPVSI
jgi:hypothetical protein